mgnify:CR=1 FL=1
MLRFQHLTKRFGTAPLFTDLCMEVDAPVVLWAPSGWGKTTLLRILMGLERPTTGSVEGTGRVAAVFQEDRLLEQHDLHPQTCFTTRDGFTTYNMVEAGLGVSFNQRLISRKWSGTVAEVPFDPPQFVTLGISVPSLREASPAAKKFIACAIETVTGGEKSL